MTPPEWWTRRVHGLRTDMSNHDQDLAIHVEKHDDLAPIIRLCGAAEAIKNEFVETNTDILRSISELSGNLREYQ